MFECSNKAWTELDKKEYTKLYYEETENKLEQMRNNIVKRTEKKSKKK